MTYIGLEGFLVKLVKGCPGLSQPVPPHFCPHRKTLSYNLIRAWRFDTGNFTGPRLSPIVRSLFAFYSAKVWRMSGLWRGVAHGVGLVGRGEGMTIKARNKYESELT